MPHIRIDGFDPSCFPSEKNSVVFQWFAQNMEHHSEGLVAVEVSGTPFFLQVKKQDDSILLKAEKISRPSPNTLVKKALQTYVDIKRPKLLYSNISGLERAKLQEPLACLKDIADFDSSKLPDKPLWIEIGFGSGRHLLHQAKMHPEVHLIGLEIHRPSLEQVMRRIELEDVENVWVIDYDARLFLELVPSNRVEKIFVHFPVPWDKKPHRRVISEGFISEATRTLKVNGTLELRTDSENYFHYAMKLFTKLTRVCLSIEKNGEAAVKSKYEERWLRLEKDIYEVHYTVLEDSKAKRVEKDFSFNPCRPDLRYLFEKKPSGAKVYTNFFVHLERFYRIDDGKGVIRVSMGSFDRPEHKYIVIDEDGVRYFPHDPVATQTNLEAHRVLKEWICET